MDPLRGLEVTEQLLRSIAGIDEFKGRWAALGNLAPERPILFKTATDDSLEPCPHCCCCEVTTDTFPTVHWSGW